MMQGKKSWLGLLMMAALMCVTGIVLFRGQPSLGMLEAFEPLVFVAGACFDVWICRL